jgi:predicted permease
MRFANRLGKLFRERDRAANSSSDLDAEIRSYADHLADEKARDGMSASEASRAARAELGGVAHASLAVNESIREARPGAWLESFAQDVRYAARLLRKSPGFTIVAVLTLALGIGANTAIFSVVDAVLLRPLPYANPDRLIVVWQSDPEHMDTGGWFNTFDEFQAWHQGSRTFDGLAAFTWASGGATINLNGERRHVAAMPVSADFFQILGVRPVAGRTFEPADLQRGCTTILSSAFWKSRLGGAPSVLGSEVALDEAPCLVVGIMPPDFSFYPKQVQLWTLITDQSDFAHDPVHSMVGVLGLLKPGATRTAAQAELKSLQEHTATQQSPELAAFRLEPDVLDLQREFTWLTGRNLRSSVVALFASVLFVLLIACLNVGSLLLGRAAARRKEFGVRLALGSSRARAVRLLLAECMILSVTGAAIGTGLAVASLRYLNAVDSTDLPPGNPVGVNWQVLVFVAFVAALAVVLFGLSPAWKMSRVDVSAALQESGQRGTRGALTRRATKMIVAAEVALSLILLVGAGLLITSLAHLAATPVGFAPQHLFTANMLLPAKAYPKPADWLQFEERTQSEIAAVPGVLGVAFAPQVAMPAGSLVVEGENPRESPGPVVDAESISSSYFRVMEIPLLRGRAFDDRDRDGSQLVAIVNQALAEKFFGKQDPMGRAIKLDGKDQKWLTIVGVVGNVKSSNVFQEMGYVENPCVYLPFRQAPVQWSGLVVRSASDPATFSRQMRQAMAAVDSTLPSPEFETMNGWLSQAFTQPRFRAVLFGAFAALALFLASVGIYAVIAQSVAQRSHEIGIRMAVGARRGDVLGMILGEGMRLVAIGIVIGIGAAVALARLLASLLYGVSPADPTTLLVVSLGLAAVALAACIVPALRAMRVDPVIALRCD